MEKITGPLRVVVTGPESSGKTTLTQNLGLHFKAALVKEYARDFLQSTEGKYREEDLLQIAKSQYKLQELKSKTSSSLVISDTGLLVIKIWSQYKYGQVHPWIDQHLENYADLYLLCKPDLPWEEDPLRENPENRDDLFAMYHEELVKINTPFRVIQGADRFHQAKQAIEAFL